MGITPIEGFYIDRVTIDEWAKREAVAFALGS